MTTNSGRVTPLGPPFGSTQAMILTLPSASCSSVYSAFHAHKEAPSTLRSRFTRRNGFNSEDSNQLARKQGVAP